MPGYISEFRYSGDTSEEFIEIALPVGTDPSGYSITIYNGDGTVQETFSLGSSVATMGGQDVYVIDSSTPFFSNGSSIGRFDVDSAVALTEPGGTVEQFLSYRGNTVTATEGPADGMTSSSVGNVAHGASLQSDDGGATYYEQDNPNSGTIPACYARGSLIATPTGERPVETLCIGDFVSIRGGNAQQIRWVWSGQEPLENVRPDQKPVMISKGALGPNLPHHDLIVSSQHRIAVGLHHQLENAFSTPAFVPAKALTDLRGIRFMRGKKFITWHHFLCADHCIVFANGLASETLLLGPIVTRCMNRRQLDRLSNRLGRKITTDYMQGPALPIVTVGDAKENLQCSRQAETQPFVTSAVQGWDGGASAMLGETIH